MSVRERKLVWLFGVLLLCVAFLFYINYHNRAMAEMHSKLAALKGKVMISESAEADHKALQEDKEWLNQYEPVTLSVTDAQIELMKFVKRAIAGRSAGSGKDPATELDSEDGGNYTRIALKIEVKMSPFELNTLLCKLHQPKLCRAVTSLVIIPADNNSANDLVKCTAIVEQWLTKPLTENDDL